MCKMVWDLTLGVEESRKNGNFHLENCQRVKEILRSLLFQQLNLRALNVWHCEST